MPVVLNSGLSVKAKAQNMYHEKSASKWSRNWKKKVWLRRGLNPQLSWLFVYVILTGMYHSKWPVFPLHQCLQHAVMNERKQLSISNHHSPFNFVQVPFQCVLGMPRNSVIKAEVYAKNIDFREKICSPAGFEPATSWMQISCSTHWAMWLWFSMECCSSFLHFFVFNPLQITTFTHSDKLEVGGWWVYGVGQLICWSQQSQVSYWCDFKDEKGEGVWPKCHTFVKHTKISLDPSCIYELITQYIYDPWDSKPD